MAKAAKKKGVAQAGHSAMPMARAETAAKAGGGKAPKAVRRVEKRLIAPFEPSAEGATPAVLDRIWGVVEQRRVSGQAATSHSARLLARGTPKVAQKLGEEAVELVIEAMTGDRQAIICESADVLYHMLVLWVDAGVKPDEVWGELRRREGISGIAEKAARPKAIIRLARTTKLP